MSGYGQAGYIGQSRSERSEIDIDNDIIPLSMMNKYRIESFVSNANYTEEQQEILNKTAISKWKYCAEHKNVANTWHHTGKFYNVTTHYSLESIADKILELGPKLEIEYKLFQAEKKQEQQAKKAAYKYAIITVDVWGGTRARPKIIDTDTQVGILIENWVYYDTGKYSKNSNKVKELKQYDSYKEMVKANKEYTGTSAKMNKIIKKHLK